MGVSCWLGLVADLLAWHGTSVDFWRLAGTGTGTGRDTGTGHVSNDYIHTPSEIRVAQALKISFHVFLLDTTHEPGLKKFILDQAIPDRIPGMRAAA